MFRNKEIFILKTEKLSHKKQHGDVCVSRHFHWGKRKKTEVYMGTEKEDELEYLCGMVQSGKVSCEDAVRYLELMKDEYGIGEKQFQVIYETWTQNGELCGKLSRDRNENGKCSSLELYKYVLDGMYEMAEAKEMDLEMIVQNFREDRYKVKKDPDKGWIGFYPQLTGCIGYGKNQKELRKNMEKVLKNWIYARYDQWRERQIMREGVEEFGRSF